MNGVEPSNLLNLNMRKVIFLLSYFEKKKATIKKQIWRKKKKKQESEKNGNPPRPTFIQDFKKGETKNNKNNYSDNEQLKKYFTI